MSSMDGHLEPRRWYRRRRLLDCNAHALAFPEPLLLLLLLDTVGEPSPYPSWSKGSAANGGSDSARGTAEPPTDFRMKPVGEVREQLPMCVIDERFLTGSRFCVEEDDDDEEDDDSDDEWW